MKDVCPKDKHSMMARRVPGFVLNEFDEIVKYVVNSCHLNLDTYHLDLKEGRAADTR